MMEYNELFVEGCWLDVEKKYYLMTGIERKRIRTENEYQLTYCRY